MKLVCALAVFLAVSIFVVPLLAADEEEPSPNDLADDFASELKKTYKKLPESELIEKIDMLAEFMKNEKVDDKRARKGLLDALSKVAFVREKTVVAHVMKKCGELGEDVAPIVVSVLLSELKKERVPHEDVYEGALDALGKIRSENPKIIKVLVDLMKYKEDDVVARTLFAVSFYGGSEKDGIQPASGRVRKDLFENVLKFFEGVYSGAISNPGSPLKNKWTVVGEDVMSCYNKLSVPPREGNDFANPPEARAWFNDHKKESWDKRD